MKENNFPLICFLFFILLSGINCFDRDDCPDDFRVPAQIIPYQLEYKVGDTIRMVSKFHRMVLDKSTGRQFDMNNINWHPNTVVDLLDTIGFSKITNYFKFISNSNYKEYILSKGYSLLEGEYTYKQDTYYLEFILIPKYAGNYFLSQKCGIGPGDNNQSFPGFCRRVGYYVSVNMNAGKNGNIQLLKESKDTLYNTIDANSPNWLFYDKGGFCFRVVP